MTAAHCILILLCPISFSSNVANPRIKVAMVAPLYIANDRFFSTLTLTNKTDEVVEAFVTFDSLEGEETARRPTIMAPRSTISIDVDGVPMTHHRFTALGSISVFVASPVDKPLVGQVTIASRAGKGKIHVEEDLQPVDTYLGPLRVGFVPAAFSVPVLAVRSLNQLSERISVICSDSAGGSYESQLLLPAHMTLLLNACIRGKTESRTYEQLLSGDTGPLTRRDMTIKVTTADPQSAVFVWGFAAANIVAESGPRLIAIEFAEWDDPFLEFLQGTGGPANYNVFANPGGQQVTKGSGISTYENVSLISSNDGAVNPIVGQGALNANSQLVDNPLELISTTPLPVGLKITDSQDMGVGGIYVRNNTLTFGSTGLTVTNNGPYN